MHPEALEMMHCSLREVVGNPSSVHRFGRQARGAIERARTEVAALIGAYSDELLFTAGGTESDHLALHGAAWLQRHKDSHRRRIVLSPLEHPAVLGAAQALGKAGFELVFAKVSSDGTLVQQSLIDAIDESTALVSLQLANHELGNLYPLGLLVEHAHHVGALFHTDAVQAAGKVAVDVHALDVDLASFSAHKIYGPKGAGALYARRGLLLEPLLAGGHQERGQRPGTENVAALVGFGKAAKLGVAHAADWREHVTALRDRFEGGAAKLGARVNGSKLRVGNTCNLAFDGVDGELLVESLDLAGVAASTGAACTSGSREPSPVLLALGQSRRQALLAVRFSFGRENSSEEVDHVLHILPPIIERIRSA